MFTRRKLTIYTAYYVSGILFAWLCFDRRELIHAALVICVCIGVCRMMTAELAKGLAVSFLAGSLLMSAGYFRLLPDEEMTEKYGEFECSVMSETVREDYISVYASTCVNDRERVFRINIYDDIPAKGNLTGTVIKVAGVPEIPDVMRNPGTFDYRLFLKGKGATYVLNADEVQYIGPAEGIRAALRRKLIEEKTEFLSRIGPEAGPYISGMLFGDTASIDEEEYDKFKANGTAHILAVSGLHVGFLLALLIVLTRKRRTPAVSSVLPAILVLYGEMTGWSVSTQRAVIMSAMALWAVRCEKRFDMLSSLMVSIIVVSALNPYVIFQQGFQMSVISVAGLCFAAGPVGHFVKGLLTAPLSVQLFLLPYTAYRYNMLNPLSVLINIPVVFLAGIAVPLSIIAFVIGSVTGWYPEALIRAAGGIAQMTERVNDTAYLNGNTVLTVTTQHPFILFLTYAILLMLLSERFRIAFLRKENRTIAVMISVCLIVSACGGILFGNPFADDEIVFIDVGQGDAVHVRCGDADALIDGGGNIYRNIGKEVLKPYFLANGARDIDVSMLTHLHTDHCKGASELREELPVKMTALPGIYKGTEHGMEDPVFLGIGDVIKLDEKVSIEMLWPPLTGRPADLDSADENELNAVYMIDYDGIRIMVTGDLLEKGETDMLKYYKDTSKLKCDILKVAHHGSMSSSSAAFLDAADPGIAVIQVGEDNTYGHPSQHTLERLAERGIPVYRNDLSGAIGIDIRKGRITVDRMIS